MHIPSSSALAIMHRFPYIIYYAVWITAWSTLEVNTHRALVGPILCLWIGHWKLGSNASKLFPTSRRDLEGPAPSLGFCSTFSVGLACKTPRLTVHGVSAGRKLFHVSSLRPGYAAGRSLFSSHGSAQPFLAYNTREAICQGRVTLLHWQPSAILVNTSAKS